jgi:TRAP-type uncharacterized transport system substrate-binding protein
MFSTYKFRVSWDWIAALLIYAFMTSVLAFWPQTSRAQDTKFSLGTGGQTGAYFTFGKQLSSVCGETAGFTAVVQENGTEGNVDAVLANRFPWFIGQVDYLAFRGMSEDLSVIKVLMPLFPEQVLFLTRNDVTSTSGGFNVPLVGNVGGTKTQLADVTQLTGRKVGAFGGAKATANLIRLQGGVAYEIMEYTGWDAAYAALSKKEVDAIVAVQAKTEGNLRGLPDAVVKSLRVLPIPAETVARFKSYRPAQVKYPNMAPASSMEVMSALFTRNYTKGPMVARTEALRKCAMDAADAQSQMPGTSPAWANIKSGQDVPWEKWAPPSAAGRK